MTPTRRLAAAAAGRRGSSSAGGSGSGDAPAETAVHRATSAVAAAMAAREEAARRFSGVATSSVGAGASWVNADPQARMLRPTLAVVRERFRAGHVVSAAELDAMSEEQAHDALVDKAEVSLLRERRNADGDGCFDSRGNAAHRSCRCGEGTDRGSCAEASCIVGLHRHEPLLRIRSLWKVFWKALTEGCPHGRSRKMHTDSIRTTVGVACTTFACVRLCMYCVCTLHGRLESFAFESRSRCALPKP